MSKSVKNLLVLGTGSHAGKSLVAAGLCRILSNRGLSVAPYKAQNMALNSGVTPDGGEIGRAQILQARAARCLPRRDMNPVLLKPVRGQGSQVILRGKPKAILSTDQYLRFWPKAAAIARQAYLDLAKDFQWIILEGAGSPAEVNLAKRDLANLEASRFSKAPWILVVDIDRGGSFAAIVGTLALVPKDLRKRFRGVVFNKFRGDQKLLDPGITWLKRVHGIRTLGVLPMVEDLGLEEEDSLGIPSGKHEANKKNSLKIEVIHHRHISNFNDLSPLQLDPTVTISWRKPGQGQGWVEPDLIVLPGSKHTLADLAELRVSGEAERIQRLAKKGTWLLGLCGGYQMLGFTVRDPEGSDGGRKSEGMGLGLLAVDTEMAGEKKLANTQAVLDLFGKHAVKGYRIHQGRTSLRPGTKGCFSPVALGAKASKGRVFGTYLHGILENDSFRRAYVHALRKDRRLPQGASEIEDFGASQERRLDAWAALLEKHLDLEPILS